MAQITGQLGTSESRLGQFELGVYDSEIIKIANSQLSLVSVASSQINRSIKGPWSKFPGHLGKAPSITLL
jgi:hypothetical protein